MAYLGENIRKLGFGMMRLPRKDDAIDLERTKAMVDLFMAAGFTYFDTAYVYTGSEDMVRQALVERYPRESYQLATKLALWNSCETRDDAIAQFHTSLERTGAGYFDFYLLHNLVGERAAKAEEFGLWDWLKEQKAAGRIKHIGFSFHSTPEELDATLTAHPEAEFVQLQINYADWENPSVQSRACYETARRHGKSVVIMEPVKGGMLANPAESVTDIFKAAEPDASPASWAVRFAASLDGVITVLSGMSTEDQVRDNVATMQSFTGLTDAQAATIEQARKALDAIPLIPCTGCDYCAKVCPQNIGISGSFKAMNILTLYNNLSIAKQQEKMHVKGRDRVQADQCIQCGQCETVCPQHIAIRDELVKVRDALLK